MNCFSVVNKEIKHILFPPGAWKVYKNIFTWATIGALGVCFIFFVVDQVTTYLVITSSTFPRAILVTSLAMILAAVPVAYLMRVFYVCTNKKT